MGSSHMGCMNQCVGCTCIEGSCNVAATDCSKVPSVPVSSSGFARGMPRGPTVGAIMSLEVEPTFLARVAHAMWHDADVEMRKIAHRARGSHAFFHVKQLHGLTWCIVALVSRPGWWCLLFVGNCC